MKYFSFPCIAITVLLSLWSCDPNPQVTTSTTSTIMATTTTTTPPFPATTSTTTTTTTTTLPSGLSVLTKDGSFESYASWAAYLASDTDSMGSAQSWVGGSCTVTIQNNTGHAGAKYLRIVKSGTGLDGMGLRLKVAGGKTYTFSWYDRSSLPGGPAWYELKYSALAGSGYFGNEFDGADDGEIPFVDTAGAWRLMTFSGTMPANTDYVEFDIYGPGPYTIDIDDLQVIEQ